MEAKISARCPIRTALELLGGKWRLLIINELKQTPLRPSELKRRVADISEKMLNQELQVLMMHHLVERKNYGEVPPRVEYYLTDAGQAALPLIEAMACFARRYDQVAKRQN